jgi:hypothetical protein
MHFFFEFSKYSQIMAVKPNVRRTGPASTGIRSKVTNLRHRAARTLHDKGIHYILNR